MNGVAIDGMVRTVMLGALQGRGFDAGDFELETEPAPLSELAALGDELVTVRRRSTGSERLYATSPESPWLLGLIVDLDEGHFGRAA